MKIFKALTWFTKKLDFIKYCTKTVTAVQTSVTLLTEELKIIWQPLSKNNYEPIKKNVDEIVNKDNIYDSLPTVGGVSSSQIKED